jgi:hypothetical protein
MACLEIANVRQQHPTKVTASKALCILALDKLKGYGSGN